MHNALHEAVLASILRPMASRGSIRSRRNRGCHVERRVVVSHRTYLSQFSKATTTHVRLRKLVKACLQAGKIRACQWCI